VTCGDQSCRFECASSTGHGGHAQLQRFPTGAAAAAAFEAIEQPRTDFHGLPASFWVGPFPYAGVPGGSSHRGAFLFDCWLATAYAYDDTHFLLGPQPSASLERIHQAASAIALFDDCDS
jgi:hypothetical protein